jgi:hypothetical protein
MALGSTQPLTEMSTRNLPGGKERPARKAHNLNVIYLDCLENVWEPRRLTTLWGYTVCYRDSFTFTLYHCPYWARRCANTHPILPSLPFPYLPPLLSKTECYRCMYIHIYTHTETREPTQFDHEDGSTIYLRNIRNIADTHRV